MGRGLMATFVKFPGTADNFVSTPNDPALQITGDLQISAKLSLDDWTPAATNTILDCHTTPNGYQVLVLSSGVIYAVYGDGTANRNVSFTAPGLADGSVHEIRITFVVGAGNRARLYVDNVEVEDRFFAAGAGGLQDDPLTVGALVNGASPLAGDVYWVEVRDGIGDLAPVVARFDAADVPVP